MVTALTFGVLASSGLVVGAAVGVAVDVSDRTVGLTLAFASGALVTALVLELFDPAVSKGGPLVASGGVLVGTTVFSAVDWVLDERVHGEEGTGLALLASVTLDGIPEYLALGVTLVGATADPPLALLAAILASNLPQALDGAAALTAADRSPVYALGLWTAIGVILVLTVVVGHWLFRGVDQTVLAAVRALAGGAVVGSLADEVFPTAYERGGPGVAVATAAGFVLTFLLH